MTNLTVLSDVRFVIPTEAYPDFLLRGPRQDGVCGFPSESRMKLVEPTSVDRKSGVA
jgi:hypothetical protein